VFYEEAEKQAVVLSFQSVVSYLRFFETGFGRFELG